MITSNNSLRSSSVSSVGFSTWRLGITSKCPFTFRGLLKVTKENFRSSIRRKAFFSCPKAEATKVNECAQKNGQWCFTYTDSIGGSGESCNDTKDACVSGRAYQLKDASLCNTITTPETKSSCVGSVTGDSSKCTSTASPDDCYLAIASSGNPVPTGLCDKINDPGKKESCRFFENIPQ